MSIFERILDTCFYAPITKILSAMYDTDSVCKTLALFLVELLVILLWLPVIVLGWLCNVVISIVNTEKSFSENIKDIYQAGCEDIETHLTLYRESHGKGEES